MDILIAFCLSLIVDLSVGFIIAWRMQKKRLEPGFNKWTNIKALNENGNRITVEIIDFKPIKGTNKLRIYTEYHNPFTNDRYPFNQTFFVNDLSPTFIQKLRRKTTTSVLIYPDITPPNSLFWMERPW